LTKALKSGINRRFVEGRVAVQEADRLFLPELGRTRRNAMPASNRLNRFWRLLAEGKHEELLSEVGQMEQAEPSAPGREELLFIWGVALWRSGKAEEGSEKMRELLKENPRSATAHLHWANMLDEMERFEEADRHYARAHELAPNASGILVDWGIMLCRWGDHDRAVEKFQQAERRLADDDNLHLYWGVSLESLGDMEGARRKLETYVVSRARREPFALARLGVVYSDLGMCEEAEPLLREAVEAEPEERDHLYNLAICLKRLQRLEEAETAARRLIELSPESAEAWGLLGDIEFERGDLEAARQRYNRSLELNPRESYTLSGLAWIAFHLGDLAEAERISRIALACDVGNASALDLIRAARPKVERLARYQVDICGETEDGARFVKTMECLARNEEEATAHVKAIQEVFSSEAWWEIEAIELVEMVGDERPGVCWISDYSILEKPASETETDEG